MIQKKLNRILFFIGLARVVRAFICVSHATEILDETNSQNSILVHNTRIPTNLLEGAIDYITVPAGTPLTEIPDQISQVRQSKGLSPYIPLNQHDKFLNYPWYINDDIFEKSPMPGRITKIESQKGQKVIQGQKLCVMEAMKMENPITSPIDGEIIDILVKVGDLVGIEPTIKLRPSKWNPLNFQNVLNNQKILSALFPWEPSIENVLPTKDLIPVLSEEIEKQTHVSQPDYIPYIISTKPTVPASDQPLKSSLPINRIKESFPLLLPENDHVHFKNKYINIKPTLLPLIPNPQQTAMNLGFPKERISSPSVDRKQIILSVPASIPQTTITEYTLVANDQPFKLSLFIDKIQGKTYIFQGTDISTKKGYNDVSTKFLPRKYDKINFKLFYNIHKNLYLLLVLFYFSLTFANFRKDFRKREISLKPMPFEKFMPLSYKPASNQNFSLSKRIKLA